MPLANALSSDIEFDKLRNWSEKSLLKIKDQLIHPIAKSMFIDMNVTV